MYEENYEKDRCSTVHCRNAYICGSAGNGCQPSRIYEHSRS